MAAKTKQDFIAEGARSARQNNTNGVMPEFGQGASWQAKAFAEGFNAWHGKEAETAEGIKIAAECAMDTEMAEFKALRKEPMVKTSGRPIPRAVIEHIRDLTEEMTRCDGARYMRLGDKIVKLSLKWELRALAGA